MNVPSDGYCTAIIYCEGHFGGVDGKTANGLVRHSPKYRILSVIDSAYAGKDAGEVLDGRVNGVPVFGDLEGAVFHASQAASCLIIGMAPSSGRLSAADRVVVLDAIALKMNIISGLHEFLSEDAQFAAAAADQGVDLIDIRKPRPNRELRLFDGGIASVTCPRIAVLGTDCAVGKRTTATLLTHALNECGGEGGPHRHRSDRSPPRRPTRRRARRAPVAVLLRRTGGRRYQGVQERRSRCHHRRGPRSPEPSCVLHLSVHPARLRAGESVILQHAPKRAHRCDFPNMAMPTPASEISLIERFAATKVIGLTLNNEGMSDAEIDTAITIYERELGFPVTDALTRPIEKLVEIVRLNYPHFFMRAIVAAQ